MTVAEQVISVFCGVKGYLDDIDLKDIAQFENKIIEKGRRNVEILKQNQNDPFQVEDQVAIIYAGSQNLLKDVPVEKVKAFEETFLQELRKNHKKLLSELKAGKISDKETDEIKKVAEKIAKSF